MQFCVLFFNFDLVNALYVCLLAFAVFFSARSFLFSIESRVTLKFNRGFLSAIDVMYSSLRIKCPLTIQPARKFQVERQKKNNRFFSRSRTCKRQFGRYVNLEQQSWRKNLCEIESCGCTKCGIEKSKKKTITMRMVCVPYTRPHSPRSKRSKRFLLCTLTATLIVWCRCRA